MRQTGEQRVSVEPFDRIFGWSKSLGNTKKGHIHEGHVIARLTVILMKG